MFSFEACICVWDRKQTQTRGGGGGGGCGAGKVEKQLNVSELRNEIIHLSRGLL